MRRLCSQCLRQKTARHGFIAFVPTCELKRSLRPSVTLCIGNELLNDSDRHGADLAAQPCAPSRHKAAGVGDSGWIERALGRIERPPEQGGPLFAIPRHVITSDRMV